ncbi:MAG: HAD-IA family hydrolase [Armatimonadota bacterium]|nr:HAD-IA family hydrolase [Armatimonadota bacterium]MDR7485098.1 HAD-IA family hydrolase [Armatimonadota bacterium]MDR7533486.1 HAD-IA family hydrolase [Armatimonadota bacterium]MDR7537013.1 HAD-IA family hydrolase [Armatimonadota bacterium]
MSADGGARFVLFDLDGTLLDSYRLISHAFRRACQEVLGRDLTDAEVTAEWGAPLRWRFERVPGVRPEQVRRLMDAYLAAYEAEHDRLATLFPGVPEMLDALRARGCRMAIVTSKRRRTTELAMHAFGLHRWVAAVVTEQDVPRPKPAPDPIWQALRALGATPPEALMVGDGVFDIEAGKRAGTTAVAALWGTREAGRLRAAGPDYEAAQPADVVALVDRLRRPPGAGAHTGRDGPRPPASA